MPTFSASRPSVSLAGLLAALLLLLAAGAAPAAAGAPGGPPADAVDPSIADGSAQRSLDAARERWAAHGVVSYRMRVGVRCFCPRQFTTPRPLTVREGRPVAPVPRHLRAYATVPRLFAFVQRAIDGRAALLTVRYGPHGVPRVVSIDRSFQIADEEIGVVVDRFRRR